MKIMPTDFNAALGISAEIADPDSVNAVVKIIPAFILSRAKNDAKAPGIIKILLAKVTNVIAR